MATPWLRGHVYWFRKGVPEDLRPIVKKTEEKFSLGTRDPAEAKVRFSRALAEVEERWARLRQGAVTLTHKELLAVAGQIYAEMVAEHSENPDFKERRGEYLHDGLAFGKTTVVEISTNKEFVQNVLQQIRARREDRNRKRIDAFLLREGYLLAPENREALQKHVELAIFKARQKINAMADDGDYGPDPEAIKFPPYHSPHTQTIEDDDSDDPLLSEALTRWIREKTRDEGWVDSTAEDNELAVRRFIELVGDRPATTYRKRDARDYKTALMSLPLVYVRHESFAGLSFPDAASKGRALLDEWQRNCKDDKSLKDRPPFETVANKTVNKNIGFLSALWNWMIGSYDVTINPFDGLKLPVPTNARDERDPFSIDQLRKIFGAPLFLGCKSKKYWQTPGAVVPADNGIYWLPLIALFTGARSGEIIQLNVGDIKCEGGIHYFRITDDGEEGGEEQEVKTDSSIRQIPVHSQLLRLGFLDFVKSMGEPSNRLFPDFPRAKDGYYSTSYAPRFKRFLINIGAKTDKHSFHSFRHNFEDEAKNRRVPLEILNALQGHSDGGMADRYGSGLIFLQTLQEEIEKVKYPDLDLTSLLTARELQ